MDYTDLKEGQVVKICNTWETVITNFKKEGDFILIYHKHIPDVVDDPFIVSKELFDESVKLIENVEDVKEIATKILNKNTKKKSNKKKK